MIKAVIFDMGGVLAKICWERDEIVEITENALREKGLELPKEFKETFKKDLYDAWLEIIETLKELGFDDVITRTLDKLGVKYSKEQIDHAVEKLEEGTFCHVDDGVEEVLKSLKEMGLKIGLISNAPGIFPINVLRRYGLDKYMDYMVTSYQVGVIKPHPKIFKTALEKLNVQPNEAIFVGDTPPIDIKGAKQVGMKTVLVKDGDPVMRKRGMAKIVDEESKPDFVIEDLSELIQIVKNLNQRDNHS